MRCASARREVFAAAIENGGVVKGIRIPKGGELSRKDLDDMTPYVATFGAKGIAWTKITARGLAVAHRQIFVAEPNKKRSSKSPEPRSATWCCFPPTAPRSCNDALGNLRLHLGEKLGFDSGRRNTPSFGWSIFR